VKRDTLRVISVATLLAGLLVTRSSWGHSFPAVRTVVVQVERCEVVLLVGYRPSSGEQTEAMLTRAQSLQGSKGIESLKATLTTQAMAALHLALDGKALVPTTVRAKLGTEPGGARPMIVLLVTYALPSGSQLALATREPRSTRISWTDRSGGRVTISQAPAQGRWFDGVASFLLSLSGSPGGPTCGTSSTLHSP
jgi:hypothetical protein